MARNLVFTGMLVVVLLLFGFAGYTNWQGHHSDEHGDRVVGTVERVDLSEAAIQVTSNDGHQVVRFDASTRFTVHNEPSSVDAVQEGRKVICRGRFDWRHRMIASRVEVLERDQ